MDVPYFDHIGIVVEDIGKTVQGLSVLGRNDPCEVFDYVMDKQEFLLAGEPFKVKLALVKLWSVTLELWQPIGSDSIWGRFLAASGEGIHHIAYSTSKWDELMPMISKKGVSMILGGRDEMKEVDGKVIPVPSVTGMRWGYFDIKQNGILIELMESA